MIYVEGYHECIGVFNTSGEFISTSKGVQYFREYREYIGGRSGRQRETIFHVGIS